MKVLRQIPQPLFRCIFCWSCLPVRRQPALAAPINPHTFHFCFIFQLFFFTSFLFFSFLSFDSFYSFGVVVCVVVHSFPLRRQRQRRRRLHFSHSLLYIPHKFIHLYFCWFLLFTELLLLLLLIFSFLLRLLFFFLLVLYAHLIQNIYNLVRV